MNPAVTVGIAAAGKMPLVDAAFYITSQMGGSFVGALIVRVSKLLIRSYYIHSSLVLLYCCEKFLF